MADRLNLAKRSTAYFFAIAASLAAVMTVFIEKAITAEPQVLIKVGRIGPPSVYDAPVFIALRDGLYKEERVNLETTELQNPSQAVSMMRAGEIDVVRVNTRIAMGWIAQGLPFKVLSSTIPLAPYFLMARSGLTLKDLSGERIAVSSLTGTDAVLIKFIAAKEGADVAKMKLFGVPTFNAKVDSLKEGVPFAILSFPELRAFEAYPFYKDFKSLVQMGAMLPTFDFTYNVVSADAIQKKPIGVEGFVSATIRGARAVVQSPGLAASRIHKDDPVLTKWDVGTLGKLMEEMSKAGIFGVNGGLNKETFEFTARLYQEAGVIDKVVRYEAAAEDKFVNAALKKYGTTLSGKGPRPCHLK